MYTLIKVWGYWNGAVLGIKNSVAVADLVGLSLLRSMTD
jgi:hypothetical protein